MTDLNWLVNLSRCPYCVRPIAEHEQLDEFGEFKLYTCERAEAAVAGR